MSYRDTYSLLPRSHSYNAAKEHSRTYQRTLMSYGGSPSSVLNSLPPIRSRVFADVTYTSTPDVNEVYPGLFVGDAFGAAGSAAPSPLRSKSQSPMLASAASTYWSPNVSHGYLQLATAGGGCSSPAPMDLQKH